jgi:hypothetical protein
MARVITVRKFGTLPLEIIQPRMVAEGTTPVQAPHSECGSAPYAYYALSI